MRETFTHPTTGDLLAELDFRRVAGGAEVAKVDDGEITRRQTGGVTVTLFTRRGGMKNYRADSVEAALITYGLTTTNCNGLPGVVDAGGIWNMPGLTGTAGRD